MQQPFISNAKTHASTSYCLISKEDFPPHVVSKNHPDYTDFLSAGYEIKAEGSKKEMEELEYDYFQQLILD